MKLAYADPPYLGMCSRYEHRHDFPWGCWDSLATHELLINHLMETYDGWALSATSSSLSELLPVADTVRIAAWMKSFAAFKANVRIAYTWEPVLFVPGRDRSDDGAAVGRDHLVCPITMQKGLTGAKPERFCRWVLDLMGWVPGDEVVDLFPGLGTLEKVVRAREDAWQLYLRSLVK